MLLALAGNIITARVLGPADFGRFGLVMAVVTICGTLADAGLTYTAVKFIARYAANVEQQGRAHEVASSYMAMRIASGIAIALAGFALAGPLAGLLGQPDVLPYLQLAFFTLVALSISSYPSTILVALGMFKQLAAAAVLNAAITVGGIILLLLASRLSLGTLIVWNVVLPLASTLPTWFLLPPVWLPFAQYARPLVLSKGTVREMLTFTRWMAVSTLGAIVATQVDLLLLGRLAGPATVGVYSVALTLAMRLEPTAEESSQQDGGGESLLTVLLPRASKLEGQASIRRYARRALAGSAGLACVLGALALLAQPLIIFLYGDRYAASSGLFIALLAAVLFDLVTSSLFLLAFPLNRPRVLAAAEWLRVAVLGVVGWLLIPGFGGYGAAAARFLSRFSGAAYTLGALRRELAALPDESEVGPAVVSNQLP